MKRFFLLGSQATTKAESLDCLAAGYSALSVFLSKHRRIVKVLALLVGNLVMLIYFIFATLYWRRNSTLTRSRSMSRSDWKLRP